MKRDSRGVPVVMVHQWNRPPLSCRRCREKKQRCDRSQPCSNCTIRNIQCDYGEQSQSNNSVEESTGPQVPTTSISLKQATPKQPVFPKNAQPDSASLSAEETLYRIRKLEEAVFNKPDQALPSASTACGWPEHGARDGNSSSSLNVTPFSSHLLPTSLNESSLDITCIARRLPPIGQARDLFSHFALVVQPGIGVLHIPFTRDLMERTYQSMLESEAPSISNLLLLFSIFAGASFGSTPQLLKELKSTQTEAKAAFKSYIRFAMTIVNDTHRHLDSSTTALAAISTLAQVLATSDGMSHEVQMLRMRCFLMANAMNVHRLDTAKSHEERRIKGCNMIEIEVQRRIWWNMVSSDWLNAFAGGPQEGAYIFQPNHMNVKYPSNVDDEFITPEKIEHDFPSSTLTSMSAFIYRLKLADLCREVADTMPSTLLESTTPDYSVVLALDAKFQAYLKQLPDFFQLDHASIQQSQKACKERPHLAWQRIGIHFSLHTRLCRLHRPYHLEGLTNSKYAYSHTTCIQSAQAVLELRRSLDNACAQFGMKPSRSWIVMEHVFLAALILATDVSFNPNAPDAESRKAEVLTAYYTLEKSKAESSALIERIQRNMQALMSTLQKRQPQTLGSQPREFRMAENQSHTVPNETVSNGRSSQELVVSSTINDDEGALNMQAPHSNKTALASDRPQNSDFLSQTVPEDEDWDQLWSEFLAVAPELDVPQWNLLLDDTSFNS